MDYNNYNTYHALTCIAQLEQALDQLTGGDADWQTIRNVKDTLDALTNQLN